MGALPAETHVLLRGRQADTGLSLEGAGCGSRWSATRSPAQQAAQHRPRLTGLAVPSTGREIWVGTEIAVSFALLTSKGVKD